MSLKKIIYEYLKRKNTWVHKGQLGRLAVTQWGYENENLGRRCREMENAGQIERKLIKNPRTGISEAWYRIKQEIADERVRKWNEQFDKFRKQEQPTLNF